MFFNGMCDKLYLQAFNRAGESGDLISVMEIREKSGNVAKL